MTGICRCKRHPNGQRFDGLSFGYFPARKAARLLESLGYENVTVKCGDGYAGWPDEAPFDAIIVTCAPDEVPQPLIEQLAEEGRMVIPVGTNWQELKLITKHKGEVTTRSIIPVRFVPMLGEH